MISYLLKIFKLCFGGSRPSDNCNKVLNWMLWNTHFVTYFVIFHSVVCISITLQRIWPCVCGTSRSIHRHVALWEQHVGKRVCLLTRSQCPRAETERCHAGDIVNTANTNIKSATELYPHSNGHLAGALRCNALWPIVEILESQRHRNTLALREMEENAFDPAAVGSWWIAN